MPQTCCERKWIHFILHIRPLAALPNMYIKQYIRLVSFDISINQRYHKLLLRNRLKLSSLSHNKVDMRKHKQNSPLFFKFFFCKYGINLNDSRTFKQSNNFREFPINWLVIQLCDFSWTKRFYHKNCTPLILSDNSVFLFLPACLSY